MSYFKYNGTVNRTLCEIFDEMRACNKTCNFSYLLSLIEEAQSAGNRMESALYDKESIEGMRDEMKRLKKEGMKLEKEIEEKKKKCQST